MVAARHRLGVRVADGGAERVADRHRGREVGAHHLAAGVHRLGVGLADAERDARQLLDAEALLQVERERLLALPLGHRREQPLVPRARRRHLGRDRAARVVARVLARVGERERVRHALPPLRVAVQPARRRRHVGLPLLPPAAHLLLDVERHRLAHRLAPRRRHLGRRLLRAHLVRRGGDAAAPRRRRRRLLGRHAEDRLLALVRAAVRAQHPRQIFERRAPRCSWCFWRRRLRRRRAERRRAPHAARRGRNSWRGERPTTTRRCTNSWETQVADATCAHRVPCEGETP